MASQVSHLVYAYQYLKKHPVKNKTEFLLGVCFPDIRLVSNVTRDQTHHYFKNLDLYFKNLSAFQAGWKFHVWCDLRRNEVLRDHGFYDIKDIKNSYYLAYYFLEDQLIWSCHKNWETIYNIFQEPLYIKTFSELNRNDWNFWYQLVAEYLKEKPSKESIEKFCKQQPALSPKWEKILPGLESLAKNKKVVEILGQVYLEMV